MRKWATMRRPDRRLCSTTRSESSFIKEERLSHFQGRDSPSSTTPTWSANASADWRCSAVNAIGPLICDGDLDEEVADDAPGSTHGERHPGPRGRRVPRHGDPGVGEERDVVTWGSWFVQAGADVEQVAQLFAGLLQEPTRRLTA